MPSWDPTQYERFADHRTRPFLDLLARVPAEAPDRVVDLGCGNGLATLTLAERWPKAEIVGVDSSAAMLQQARRHDSAGRVRWQESDVNDWQVDTAAPPDVLLTNATLQWVPGHERLIEDWLATLPAGAVFAMQVPGNFDSPSHRIIREAVADAPRGEQLSTLLRRDPVLEPAGYADLLAPRASHVDVWETTYLQLLDPPGHQESPVLEWVKGTALRPVLDALDERESEALSTDLRGRLGQAYPRRSHGVPFAFRRIFAVAVK